jgi:hypothetical protein
LPGTLGVADLAGQVDFTLAFAVVHELPSAMPFFREVAAASKPGARLWLVEPRGHVTDDLFRDEVQAARAEGFRPIAEPAAGRSHSILLERTGP